MVKKATESQKRLFWCFSLKHRIESTIADHNLENDKEYQDFKIKARKEKFDKIIGETTQHPTIMF